jgi:uncharacterized RDD family membrane protein YckC
MPPYPIPPPTEREHLPLDGPGAPGGIPQRAAGFITDYLLLLVPLQAFSSSQRYVQRVGDQLVNNTPLWFVIVVLLAPIVYATTLTAWRGQTLGQMLMRLRTVRYADGGLPTVQQAAIRTIVPAIPSFIGLVVSAESFGVLLLLLTIFIYLSAALDPLYRAVHDKASGTIVLRLR